MNAPRANAVSRFLKDSGFRRSIQRSIRTVSQGYAVTTRKDGNTVVTFELGTIVGPATQEQRRATVAYAVTRMEKALSTRYTVIMFEPDDGLGFRLTILPKGEQR